MVRRISILGIDGSGKTAVLEALRQKLGGSQAIRFMRCPDYHLGDQTDFSRLSLRLKALSSCADLVGDRELKFGSLFLKMRLFGDVERSLAHPGVRTLVQERHAIVDGLVYTALYLERPSAPSKQAVDRLEYLMNEIEPKAWESIRSWSGELQLGEIATYCRCLLSQGQALMQAALSRDFKTTLPDEVFFLDVSPREALSRISLRGASRELHETEIFLGALRKRYDEVLASLPQAVRVHRLPVDTMSIEDIALIVERHLARHERFLEASL